MRRILFVLTAATLIVGYMTTTVVADWYPGEDYKMHWPQTPRQGGWDVEFVASSIADDWWCTETGLVTDIHFWVSWMGNNRMPIEHFHITIWSDMPADHPENPYGYSVPLEPLWDREFVAGQFVQRLQPEDLQGWYDPSSGWFGLGDHILWDQINITHISDPPFIQEEGTIYWLEINFWDLPFVGWKETDMPWNDDGVWFDPTFGWRELRDPITGGSLNLAFVITGEATVICGNTNGIDDVDFTDILYLIDFIFSGGPPPVCTPNCLCANVNGINDVDFTDILYLIDYIFSSGPAPVGYPGPCPCPR